MSFFAKFGIPYTAELRADAETQLDQTKLQKIQKAKDRMQNASKEDAKDIK